MKKWNKAEEEKRLSPTERSRIKEILYRLFLENEVAVAYLEKDDVKIVQIWDYVCREAGVK